MRGTKPFAALRLPLLIAGLLAGLQLGAAAHASDKDWAQAAARQFQALGLSPGGDRGYQQKFEVRRQTVDLRRSRVQLVDEAGAVPLSLDSDLVLDAGAPQPAKVEGELVFVASPAPGEQLLSRLQGRIAVMLDRDVAAMDASARSALFRAGAAGLIALPTGVDAPAPAGSDAAAYVSSAAPRFTARVGRAAAERLFARSGRDFADIVERFRAGRTLVSFPLNLSLKAELDISVRTASASNVLGVIRGADPLLARDVVVVSADADAAETLLATIRDLRAQGQAPKRSILFALIAPEQAAVAGGFVLRTPGPPDRVVALLNASTASSPIAAVAVAGGDESTLGAAAAEAAQVQKIAIAPSAAPIEAGQSIYGFMQAGTPSLHLGLGADAATLGAAYLSTLTAQIADTEIQPVFLRGSRFAPKGPQAVEALSTPIHLPRGKRPEIRFPPTAALSRPISQRG